MKKMILIAVCLAAAGCKSPFDRTKDATGGAPTGTFSGSSTYIIFNNELQSGGGVFEYPGGDNQTLTFSDTSDPVSRRSIRYFWNGSPAKTGSTDHTFAGFDLSHVVDNTPALTIYASTPGRDLRRAGYTKVTFYVRGSLSTNTILKIEVADDGNTSTPDPCLTLSTSGTVTDDPCDANGVDSLKMPPRALTPSWQQCSITVPNSALAAIKDFFKATFVFTDLLPGVPGQAPGQGGVVYFDKIQYEP